MVTTEEAEQISAAFQGSKIEGCDPDIANKTEVAMQALTEIMKSDLDYAWGWHCNIAMCAYDSGCGHKQANDGAARFMQMLFGVDTRQHPAYERTQNQPLGLNPAEALFGFCGWLTTRKDKTILSATDDCAPIAELIKKFCEENRLSEPRQGWENNLIHPSGECSSPAINHEQQGGANFTYTYENFHLMDAITAVITPFLKPGEFIIRREPFRWKNTAGALCVGGEYPVIPNAYESYSGESVAEEKGWEVVHDFCHLLVVRKR